MSTFSYQNIILEPIYTKTFARRAIYHGPIYLYTRNLIRVQGIYNPKATSYRGDMTSPERNAGSPAALTDSSIRHLLMQPRGRLYYTAGNPNCAALPNPLALNALPPVRVPPADIDYIIDANNGPIPISCDVTRITGTETWWVDFTIKADVNECYRQYSQPAFVLSHRWNMTHDIDVNHFTTRIVRGRAIFRTDEVLRKKITLDNARAAFFHPIPDNMQRENVRVWIDEDNTTLHYSFIDREKSHIILWENVTRVEAWASFAEKSPALAEVAAGAATDLAGRAKSLLSGLFSTQLDIGNTISEVLGITYGTPISTFIAKQPVTTLEVVVRVWGNRKATRDELWANANTILMCKLPRLFDGMGLRTALFATTDKGTFDLVGRYVSLGCSIMIGQASSAAANVAQRALQAAQNLGILTNVSSIDGTLRQQFPEIWEDEIKDASRTYIRAKSGPGKNMLSDNGSRGTYLENCIAQALQSPCAVPPRVEATPRYNDSILSAVNITSGS